MRRLLRAFPATALFWLWTSNSRAAFLLREQAGAAGDVRRSYGASSALTQTNLDGLAASPTHVAGWESAAIDNTSTLALDYRITATIQVESSGLSAGEIRLYLVGPQEDSTWPDVFDGSEGTETVADANVRDAICHLGAVTLTDTSVSQLYYLSVPSVAAVFHGNLPKKFVCFLTQSTGAALETTGDPNQVFVTPVFETVAQS